MAKKFFFFLLRGFSFSLRFVTADEKKQNGTRKESEVLIQRRKEATVHGAPGTVTVPYRVIDSTQRLQSNDW
jgi:parafibromin